MPAAKADRGAMVRRLLPFAVIIALVLGLGAGVLLRPNLGNAVASGAVDAADVVGTMWFNALRMTVVPLVVPLLIGAIAGARSSRAVGRLGLATLGWFFAIMLVEAVVAVLVVRWLYSGLHIDPTASAALRKAAAAPLPTGDVSLSGWLKALVPVNPVKAAADGSMLALVVFATAFGFATLSAPADARARVLAMTETLTTVMLVLVEGVIRLAPIGVFALTLVAGANLGGAAFGALAYHVIVVCGVNVLTIVVLCGLGIWRGGIAPGRFVRGAAPAMMIAAGTSSSLASLPAMVETTIETWELPEEIAGFVLTTAVSIVKPAAVPIWICIAVFIGLLYGVPLDGARIALVAGYAVLLNATIPGVPNGGFIVIAALFVAVGLPPEGLALVVAFGPITDRFNTVGNITADLAVTAILGRGERRRRPGI